MIRFLISIFFAFGAVIFAVFIEGFNPINLIGFSAFLVAVSIPLISSFGVWKAGEIVIAWKDPFSKKKNDSFAVSMKILEFQEKLFYISGIVGLILGFIIVLNNIKFYQTIDRICFGIAATLICPLYGILFAAVMRVMRARIDNAMSK
jgi:flagellar motor component MotA